jgi:hypothetical protein
VLGRGFPVEAVDDPAGVVPVDPVGGDLLDVTEPVEWATPER